MHNYIHAKTHTQYSDESLIADSGLYDFNTLSKHELDIVVSVMRIYNSNKYPKALRSLGLLNETYPIVYKPRYKLLDVIIQLFDKSSTPYDLLAVAEAYRLKGAAYRTVAIEKYEQYWRKANVLQKNIIKSRFLIFSDLFLLNNLSELYEKEHDLYRALKYAELAEHINTDKLPHYPLHISKILLKIDPPKAVSYLSEVVSNRTYRSSETILTSALQEAKQKACAGYRYKPKNTKNKINSIDDDIQNAALDFLHGGKYYNLWAK